MHMKMKVKSLEAESILWSEGTDGCHKCETGSGKDKLKIIEDAEQLDVATLIYSPNIIEFMF